MRIQPSTQKFKMSAICKWYLTTEFHIQRHKTQFMQLYKVTVKLCERFLTWKLSLENESILWWVSQSTKMVCCKVYIAKCVGNAQYDIQA